VQGCLRQIAFLDGEIAIIERALARHALGSEEIRRLMTIPGVDLVVAATFMAQVGDIRRFPSARHLVGYLGLDQAKRAKLESGDVVDNGLAGGQQLPDEIVAAGAMLLVKAPEPRPRARPPVAASPALSTVRRSKPVIVVTSLRGSGSPVGCGPGCRGSRAPGRRRCWCR